LKINRYFDVLIFKRKEEKFSKKLKINYLQGFCSEEILPKE